MISRIANLPTRSPSVTEPYLMGLQAPALPLYPVDTAGNLDLGLIISGIPQVDANIVLPLHFVARTPALGQPLGPIGEQLIGRMYGRALRADDGVKRERVVVALVGGQDHRERIARVTTTVEAGLGAIGKRRHKVGKPCVFGGDKAQATDPERHEPLLLPMGKVFRIARLPAPPPPPGAWSARRPRQLGPGGQHVPDHPQLPRRAR